ncbi:7554_t:CDS:2 [Diversispora eburnea]|uniref:7554_t:CDS:1 n=1 Tax=Diversispora eburnea TaxID=1213867 RepID=A0A9N8VCJ8_9GLOM|nr:7554_t:CDS:2 [Diversispora eburnea]
MIQNLQVEVATISPKDDIEIIKTTTNTITATISSNIDEDINILSKKMAKRVVTFQPRSSQLDRETLEIQQDSFRGFFTLFWIGMAFYILQTGAKNFVSAGVLFNLSFFRLFSQDASGLILSDACMIGSMFFAVFLQKLISKELIRWKYVGMIIQHIYQILFLFVPIYWTFLKNWPWVQSGFFVLHTISMLMKLHSYSFYNGELSEWALRLKSLKRDYFTLIGESKKSDEIEGYLNSPAGNIRYSDNITIMNFIDFLLVPTLVYELEYPRTDNTTWEEFARKWNKPVHHFLLRHVYHFSIESYKLSKRDATFMTFFLSSLIHELVMVVVSKKFRMYLFCFQMLQLPLIALSKLPLMKDKKWFGNGFFWFGLFLGPPILGILYCREVFMQ